MAMMEFTDRPLTVAVITVSDTRTKETDKGGARVEELAREAGFEVVSRQIVTDTIDEIQGAIHQAFTGNYDEEVLVFDTSTNNAVRAWTYVSNVSGADIIISTGGTGIAKRDVSIEAVQPLLDKEISGFGELFRFLSYRDDIGTKALASRAIGGVKDHTILFAIPGSVGAVTLAMKELILPEVKHLKRELIK
jgi:molybdenum cofactor biosynthesis protein B